MLITKFLRVAEPEEIFYSLLEALSPVVLYILQDSSSV
jgi:hypothetical protein